MFSITDTIRESLKLAWKHKILWVFALLLTSGLGFRNFNNQDYSFLDKKTTNSVKEKHNINDSGIKNTISYTQETHTTLKENINQDIKTESQAEVYNQTQNLKSTKPTVATNNDNNLEYLEKVKAVTNQFLNLQDEFLNKLGGYVIFVALAVILFVIFAIGLSLFLRSFATGALIGGVDDVLNNKSYSLFTLANWGRKNVRQLFKYNIYVAILSF